MKIKILSSSKEIKAAIKAIFKLDKQRRVAIAAFVGDEAHAYLGNPENLELYCWPKAGGTNPAAIRELKLRGTKVYFSDSLHMKLYWSNQGAVMTSANLSTFALGAGGLKEIGVLLPASSVNIDKIINSLNARVAREKEISDLELAHKKVFRMNPDLAVKSHEDFSFKQWYGLKSHKKGGDWKLASFSTANVRLAAKVAQALEKEHGNKSYEYILECFVNNYHQDDWLLCYEFNGIKPVRIAWQYAHHVVRFPRKVGGKIRYGFQIVQVNKMKAYDRPPFDIDAVFKNAFVAAHNEYYKDDEDKMNDEIVPSTKLLNLIAKKMGIV